MGSQGVAELRSMIPLAMSDPVTRCIECGGFVDSLNEDEDGVPCPACSERLLETLPGIFHSAWAHADEEELEECEVEIAEQMESEAGPAPEWRRVKDDIVLGPDQPA